VIRLVLNRLLGMVIATIGASFLAFAFMRVLPGNPARLILGPLVPQKSVNQLAHDMGLDQSIPIQYWRYMRGFFTGDWGFSYSTGLSVWTVIWQRLPATLELDVYGFVFGTSLAFALALAATYRRRPLIDRLVRGIAYLGLGTPPFWLGLLLLITLSERWKIFPGPDGRLSPTATAPPDVTGFYTIDALVNGDLSTFRDALAHLILPAFTLGFLLFAVLVRLLRANLLGVEREHFLLVVKSKGGLALVGVPAARSAERRAAHDHGGGAAVRRAADGQRARRARLQLAGRRRARRRLDPAQGLLGGADVHPVERDRVRRDQRDR
jgi:ABC-type dipeptide/oligopeptide/nickel transport system permease component